MPTDSGQIHLPRRLGLSRSFSTHLEALVRRACGHVVRLGRVVVRGTSMEPTLRDGDHLLVRWGGRVQPGRLAVVRLPERPLSVKRVTMRTPDGWWAERDNPREGVDSWLLGAVRDEDVVATVVCRYWPPVRPSGQ